MRKDVDWDAGVAHLCVQECCKIPIAPLYFLRHRPRFAPLHLSPLCSEKDLDEVLQTTTVYSNVSKAVLASREDLKLVFGTDDEDAVCRFILAHGDLQVSDRERKLELDTKFRDVAAVISEKCINPTTQRPYTIPMIERALKDTHFSVDSNRPAKTQALEVGALAWGER